MVETARLLLLPLTYDQLNLYLEGESKLEKILNLADQGRTVSPKVKKMAHLVILPKMKKSTNDYFLFYTFWLAIEKISTIIVAELGFKGPPDKSGGIEIGYGTLGSYRNKHFMTEAVSGIISWARERTDIHYILAETDKENLPSIKVVQNNNFLLTDTRGKMIWWKIMVK
jgi:[ribosomal protein S5]-alanine N-acetyltransferase